MSYKIILFLSLVILAVSCTSDPAQTLPYIGEPKMVEGQEVNHTIPDFSFIDADSAVVDNKALSNNIYVADFFFTYCPSICPKVKQQMIRVYDKYEKEDALKLVSHTLDPIRDDPQTLKEYAAGLGVDTNKWLFLTGDKTKIWDMAREYFVTVLADEEAPSGIDHSGKMILVDKDGHVRAFAEGTDPESVTKFLTEIDILLAEHKSK